MIVAIVGIDGAGKTTLAEALAKMLGTTPIGMPPRNTAAGLLFHTWAEVGVDRTPTEWALLAAAAHNEWALLVSFAVSNMVFDRYLPCDYAYRYAEGWPIHRTNEFHERHYVTTGRLPPATTIWLDTPVDVAMQRIAARGKPPTIFERAEHLTKVRAGYEAYFDSRLAPRDVIVIDGSHTREAVYSKAARYLENKKGRP